MTLIAVYSTPNPMAFFKQSKRATRLRRRRPAFFQSLEQRLYLAGDAPSAVNDLFTAEEGLVVVIDALANDQDAENDPLNIVAVTQGNNGNVINNGSTLTFSPDVGFLGSDSFTYTITDGTSQSTATVDVTINATLDAAAARTEILAGVSTLADPGGPGHMVVYGPTAISIANYPGGDLSDPLIAAATLGSGRVVALGDHQYLNLATHGSDTSTAAFYNNSVGWLGATTLNEKIVTYNSTSNRDWLTAQGYTNVVNSTASSLAAELVGAKVLVGAWLGNNASQSTLDTVGDFVKDGGGLFVVDYGIGYDWWWNKETPDIPGNLLLREAGIGFTKDWPHSGSQTVTAATGQMTARDVLAILQDSSATSEADKVQAAAILNKLNEVLAEDDLLQARLDAEFFARINSINPTPANPVSDVLEQTLLRREMDLIRNLPPAEVTAHRTVDDVYGQVPAGAARVSNHVVSIDTNHSGYLPTGLYVPPGEVVTITFPASLVGQGYDVQISGHVDNISGRSSWNRVPYGAARSFPIDSETIDIANAFGGAIYIDVGGQAGGTAPMLGQQDITISGAVLAPTFKLGETTNQQWIDTIRDYPAPFAELISERLSISLPSSMIRDLVNPHELMTLWNDVVAFQDWVGGFENTRTGPDRFNVDVQISVGYLHAGYPIQGPTHASFGLVDYEELTRSGNWGYFHELGHEMQRHPELGWGYGNPWTFSGDTEVTVNIFANAALETAAPSTGTSGWGYSAHIDATMERAVTSVRDINNPNFDDKDPYPFYFQLADGPWGWQGYRDVLSGYVDDQLNDPTEIPTTNQEKKDQWLIRWSTVSGYDMTRYMVGHWGLEVTQAAKDSVAALSFPSWMPLAMQRSEQHVNSIPGAVETLPLATAGLGLDTVANFVSVTQPANGTLTDNGDGSFSYQSHFSFVGTDTFSVTYQSSAGNQQAFDVTVEVGTQGLLVERFNGIGGTTIASLRGAAKFPDAPDHREVANTFEIDTNQADNFGVRARGYLTVPVSGDYQFWIASDDNGELWLGSDHTSESASLIASVNDWTSSRQWDKFPSQQSNLVSLVAGERYYVEALMKEGGGGDNLAVAWSGPGIDGPEVIDGEYITVFGVAPYAPQVETADLATDQTQRSIATNLTVEFDSEVIIDQISGTPFQLINRDTNVAVGLQPIASVIDGKTIVTATFLPGPSVRTRIGANSLIDGNYQLTIDSNLVGAIGQVLDGDRNGVGGDDFVHGTAQTDLFFQLFGDTDGDRDVDVDDLNRFGQTFRQDSGNASFNELYDFDGDGDVDVQDLGEFGKRFRTTLNF